MKPPERSNEGYSGLGTVSLRNSAGFLSLECPLHLGTLLAKSPIAKNEGLRFQVDPQRGTSHMVLAGHLQAMVHGSYRHVFLARSSRFAPICDVGSTNPFGQRNARREETRFRRRRPARESTHVLLANTPCTEVVQRKDLDETDDNSGEKSAGSQAWRFSMQVAPSLEASQASIASPVELFRAYQPGDCDHGFGRF